MPITNKVQFVNQERTTSSSTKSASYVWQGTMLEAAHLIPTHDYFMLSWANCNSPGANAGSTKWMFEATSTDIVGSEYQRHDTNDSGMCVTHLGQFTAPTPTENIGIYRKRIAGGDYETTDYGQFFVIDLSYVGDSGSLVSGVDFSTSMATSARTVDPNNNFHEHTVTHSGVNLVFATVKALANPDPVLIGLYINDVLVSSGSRYTKSAFDKKEVVFAGAYNISSGQTVKLKNVDSDTASTDYSYVAVFNLDTAPSAQATGQLTSWTDYSISGSWGAKTIDGNNQQSFVVGMGRQLETGVGAESGRPACISLKNNTSNKWMLFNNRPSGEWNPLYFPSVNYGHDTGQRETSIIIGVGEVGDGDEIEMVTI